jgi:predicted metal-dependent RNase
MSNFRFTNLTRNLEIGANCYLLEVGNRRVVLDCGAHPKQEGKESLPLIDTLAGSLWTRSFFLTRTRTTWAPCPF